jgi:hypothetical protein
VVRAYSAEHLFQHDVVGSLNPYVEVRFAGSKPARTRVIKGSTNPVWDEELRIPVKVPVDMPPTSDRISIKLFSSRTGAPRDHLIATAVFKFTAIKSQPYGPRYYILYGAPSRLVKNREWQLMNLGRTEGTEFRGIPEYGGGGS